MIDSEELIESRSSIRDAGSRLEKFMMREESIVRVDSIRREDSIRDVDSMLREDSANFKEVYIATNYCLSF